MHSTQPVSPMLERGMTSRPRGLPPSLTQRSRVALVSATSSFPPFARAGAARWDARGGLASIRCAGCTCRRRTRRAADGHRSRLGLWVVRDGDEFVIHPPDCIIQCRDSRSTGLPASPRRCVMRTIWRATSIPSAMPARPRTCGCPPARTGVGRARRSDVEFQDSQRIAHIAIGAALTWSCCRLSRADAWD